MKLSACHPQTKLEPFSLEKGKKKNDVHSLFSSYPKQAVYLHFSCSLPLNSTKRQNDTFRKEMKLQHRKLHQNKLLYLQRLQRLISTNVNFFPRLSQKKNISPLYIEIVLAHYSCLSKLLRNCFPTLTVVWQTAGLQLEETHQKNPALHDNS